MRDCGKYDQWEKWGVCQVNLMQKQSLDLCLETFGFRDFISDMGVGDGDGKCSF